MVDKIKANNDSYVNELIQEENEVYLLYRRMQDAMIAKDIRILDTIILDGTRMRHSNGSTQSKAEFFQEITTGVLNYYHTDLKDVQIEVTGNTAVLKCVAYMRAKVYGMSGTFPLRVEAYFEKRDEQWFYTDSDKPY
ncbi:nuclear transport factor 2 family protein [Anaeromicropila herbilytica]|uniref:DUF4440 domain-containing protein n=1 Tax=Anaeromicropila herbilytica TaxID=2785025 RepID=A0A7R7IEF6_9FIRM|nr:nuclear transport factor 2 family protein [Anaeromicropila herbilytica]BCN31058.1 hypothetical protein bsdtb5_23530 [Anaeromicropila herbilytica]